MKPLIQSLKIDWDRISKGSYLRRIPTISSLKTMDFTRNVSYFVGENGTGKSTLIEAIAVAYGFNPEGGTKNYLFSTYDSHSELHNAVTLARSPRKPKWSYFLRAESFYNVATQEIEYADPGHPSSGYHEESHGESFLDIAINNFEDGGLYLLDEPEAALSPQRQLTLLRRIYDCSQSDAQFIIVTHSPILLATPDADIFSFDGDVIHKCEYEETDSYQIMKMFINDREHILNELLKD